MHVEPVMYYNLVPQSIEHTILHTHLDVSVHFRILIKVALYFEQKRNIKPNPLGILT